MIGLSAQSVWRSFGFGGSGFSIIGLPSRSFSWASWRKIVSHSDALGRFFWYERAVFEKSKIFWDMFVIEWGGFLILERPKSLLKNDLVIASVILKRSEDWLVG